MTNTNQVEVKLVAVKELSFACSDIITDADNETIEKNLKIEIGFEFHVSKDTNEFNLSTLIQYIFKKAEVLKFENQCVFSIINIDQVVKYEGDKINIKDEFLISLLNITIGTTRGMMVKNTMGKRLNDFPLPILNPKELLNNLKEKK